ncbi:hypothetical protein D3C71_1940120 [compost metagenome]
MRDLFSGKIHRQRTKVVLQLLGRTRTNDRNGAVRADPCDGDLAWRDAQITGDGNDSVKHLGALRRIFRLKHLAAKALSTTLYALTIFPRQHAAAQRRPSHNSES